jgi:predicted nucleotidyltransferase
MLSKEFKVIKAFLLRPFDQMYGREIERIAGITHSRAVAYLKNLAAQKILISKRRGNQLLYSLNPNNEIMLKALAIAELERKGHFFKDKPIEKSILYRLISDVLEKCPDAILFSLLFGSYARGHARESSDLDVLFVVSKNKYIKRDLEEVGQQLEESTDRKISVHVVGIKEIGKLWLSEPAYKGIWNDRIVLYGEESFWRFVYRMGGHQ